MRITSQRTAQDAHRKLFPRQVMCRGEQIHHYLTFQDKTDFQVTAKGAGQEWHGLVSTGTKDETATKIVARCRRLGWINDA